ncbi:MAG: hypothetical protein HXX18_12250 [Bacteroidetes bacterium]|nr:hypothetical protein [Bacteroidota bacterium]
MKKKLFRLFINCFLTLTVRNHKRMAKQSTTNYEALKSKQSTDSFIKELFLKTAPIYTTYHNLLGDLVSTKATKKGTVLSFNNYLKTLRTKLKDWDIFIQGTYKEGTPEYVMLFPNGKSFILEGTQEQIVSKFTGFNNNVQSNPDLVTIKDEVNSYLKTLNIYYGSKNEKLSVTETSTTELDNAYDQMGKALYYNMLMLTAHFIDNPIEVEDYFDMTLLRTHEKEITEEESLLVSIPPATSKDSGFSIAETGKYLIMSRSNFSLQFYGASTASELPKTRPRELVPGEEVEVSGAELGAPANRFLIFVNPSITATGEVEILQVE